MVVLMIKSRIWLAAVAGVLFLNASAAPVRSQQPRVISITAERFSFTPSEIVVDAGEPIELRIKSDDTAHGFRIPGAGVNVVIPKRGRREAVVPFRAPEPGRYEFECSRMCGAGHNFMRGVLIVRDPAGKTTEP
jgi:cytochrome c oxidase subunit 2